MTQITTLYRGYRLEVTSVACDVVDPRTGEYLETKISVEDAKRIIDNWLDAR